MRNPFGTDYFKEGQKQYLDIEPQALFLRIFKIKGNLLGNRNFIAPVDLSPTSQARFDKVNITLCARFDKIVLIK